MTRWKIATIDGKVPLNALTLTLAIDSNEPGVLDAIETAAARHGIELERDDEGGFLTGTPA